MADEYIRREDARRAVIGRGYNIRNVYSHDEELIFKRIDRIPAADVAPVVLCKDCRFYEVKQSKLCDMHNMAAFETDYCSYGVRKEPTNEPQA